jgi:dihydrolipoamide dehydrogenase
VGIVGMHASELIAEGSLALEMGATLEDLMVAVHRTLPCRRRS